MQFTVGTQIIDSLGYAYRIKDIVHVDGQETYLAWGCFHSMTCYLDPAECTLATPEKLQSAIARVEHDEKGA